MKILYVNIDNEQIESTESIEVLNYNLLDDFFFYLGDSIVRDSDLQVDKIALIKDFNTPDNASDFDEILKQWEELKSILFGEKPGGIFDITLPDGYIDWLRYNSNDEYRKIYSLKYSKNGKCVVSIDIDDFYTSCIKGDLLRKIKSKICKINMPFDEIVIDLKTIHPSLFAKETKEMLHIEISFGYIHHLAYVKKDGKYGFVDIHGNLVIPCIYDYARSFSEGLAYVNKDGKEGYIDIHGNLVIPCIYDYINSFKGLILKKNV